MPTCGVQFEADLIEGNADCPLEFEALEGCRPSGRSRGGGGTLRNISMVVFRLEGAVISP